MKQVKLFLCTLVTLVIHEGEHYYNRSSYTKPYDPFFPAKNIFNVKFFQPTSKPEFVSKSRSPPDSSKLEGYHQKIL